MVPNVCHLTPPGPWARTRAPLSGSPSGARPRWVACRVWARDSTVWTGYVAQRRSANVGRRAGDPGRRAGPPPRVPGWRAPGRRAAKVGPPPGYPLTRGRAPGRRPANPRGGGLARRRRPEPPPRADAMSEPPHKKAPAARVPGRRPAPATGPPAGGPSTRRPGGPGGRRPGARGGGSVSPPGHPGLAARRDPRAGRAPGRRVGRPGPPGWRPKRGQAAGAGTRGGGPGRRGTHWSAGVHIGDPALPIAPHMGSPRRVRTRNTDVFHPHLCIRSLSGVLYYTCRITSCICRGLT